MITEHPQVPGLGRSLPTRCSPSGGEKQAKKCPITLQRLSCKGSRPRRWQERPGGKGALRGEGLPGRRRPSWHSGTGQGSDTC